MGIMANNNLTKQRQVFVEEYVRSGDHLEAAKKAGYKDTHTLRNQACKLRRECADEITEELHRNFAEIAPRTLNILTDLVENAESESVRLGATRDLLDRAGFRPVDRHEIVKEKSVEELNAQLVSLVGENGGRDANKCIQKEKKHLRPCAVCYLLTINNSFIFEEEI